MPPPGLAGAVPEGPSAVRSDPGDHDPDSAVSASPQAAPRLPLHPGPGSAVETPGQGSWAAGLALCEPGCPGEVSGKGRQEARRVDFTAHLSYF